MTWEGLERLGPQEMASFLESRLEHHLCDVPPELDDGFYPAAVMMLFVKEQDAWQLLYTQRTDRVRDHKRQVAFPGGAWEENDLCLKDTALRETQEEIGVQPEDIRVLGSLPPERTVSGYFIVPFIGMISYPYPFRLQPDEVEEVFLLPLTWLSQPENREEREFTLPGKQQRRKAWMYRERDGHLLWGITASLTLQLLSLLV